MRKKIYISGIAFLVLLFGVQPAKPYSGFSSSDPLAADFSSFFEDPLLVDECLCEEAYLSTDDSTAFLHSDPFSFHLAFPVVQAPLEGLDFYILHHSYLI